MNLSISPFKSVGKSQVSGISLIEVVLAIGILCFAIIPLIGLLAMGSSSYRAAMDSTVEAAITQNIRTMSSQLSTNLTLPISYYRDDGTPSTNTNDSRLLYYVTNTILPAATMISSDGTSNTLSGTLVDQYTIIHIPSGRTNAVGVIHVYPRAQ